MRITLRSQKSDTSPRVKLGVITFDTKNGVEVSIRDGRCQFMLASTDINLADLLYDLEHGSYRVASVEA